MLEKMYKYIVNSQKNNQKVMQEQHSEQTTKSPQNHQPHTTTSPPKQKHQQLSPKLSNKPTLTYYYIRGLCQPIRNLFYHLQIPFDDRRLDKAAVQCLQLDKLQSTFNSGLPSYRDENLNMTDSVAISIYLCKKYGAQKLLGTTPRMRAKVNQVLFKYWMQKKKIMPQITQIVRKTTGYHQAEKGVLIRQLLSRLTNQTRFLSHCLRNHKNTQSWIQSELTLVDFYFYQPCFYINGFFNSYIQADENLSWYLNFLQKFQELEFFGRWDFNKTKLFFPLKSQNLREVLISAWQGDEDQEIV